MLSLRDILTRRAPGAAAFLFTGLALASLTLAGCSAGSGGAGIPGLTAAVPALDGGASYSGPRMNFLRYGHTTTILPNGHALVIGGTDERHLTATDLVEVFDQRARVPVGTIAPESISGDFIDQDIDGNLITLSTGGRFWHTASDISSGRVVVVGGTTNINSGIANPTTEIYDPLTRTFTEPTLTVDQANDIALPRVRHTAQVLPNGNLLVIGGQESTQGVPPGGGPLVRVYPSTRSMEIFDLATLTFSPAFHTGGGGPAVLTNSSGRAGHASVALAGEDEVLGTGDDVILVLGGISTLSAASAMAPLSLAPWQSATSKLVSADFYSAEDGTMNLVSGLALAERVNDPIAINLGEDHRQSPFGDFGMANIVLVFGGDSDEPCPDGLSASGQSTDRSELIVATYSGFGPGNGAMFTRFTGQNMVNGASASNTYDSGHEFLLHSRAPADGCSNFNRSRTDGVIMDMRRVYGSPRIVSVVVTAGGFDQTVVGAGCVSIGTQFCNANELAGFEFFDPFYDPSLIGNSLPLMTDIDGDGDDDLFPWEFELNATPGNPVGIGGTWLAYDSLIPDDGVVGYADGATAPDTATAALKQLRSMHTIDRIAGEDGVLGNLDDRVLVIGGSDSYYPFFGNNATSISCEIFVPPGAGP